MKKMFVVAALIALAVAGCKPGGGKDPASGNGGAEGASYSRYF